MTEQTGEGSSTARTRSAPVAVVIVLVVGAVLAAVISAFTSSGPAKHQTAHAPVPVVTPTLAASASATGTAQPPVGTSPPSASPPAPVTTSVGLLAGRTLSGVAGVGTDKALAFGTWRGKPVDVVVDYTGTRTWDGVTQLKREGLLDRGLPSSIHRVFSVPLIPSAENATLEAGAAGDYDQHFRDLAQELIDGGQSNATIRLGWEMTGDWFVWSGVKHPDQWVGAYQKAVTAMRSVTGADFTFDWTVALGFANPEPMYPGDGYVDLIGADNYDASFAANYAPTDHAQVWAGILSQSWGLDWLGKFAAEHGKRISMGEWGVTQRQDGHGGGDDPYFIEQMHAWFTAHDVAYEAYFESTDDSVQATFAIDNGQFPQAAQRYRSLFGSSSSGVAPAPSAPPTAPVSTPPTAAPPAAPTTSQ